ncbi:hypothetical protein L1I79_27250 [Strepomyces sp. STD 3.1]|nr:hypothetical protein [Streptomyces sp. STD 3.1]
MPEITETTVRELSRISSTATYGYSQIRVERRDQYEWDNPEVPVYVTAGGVGGVAQQGTDPCEAAAFLLGSIQAGLEIRDDFHLSTHDQEIVDTAAAQIPDEGDCEFWRKYGRTQSIGLIRGVQEKRLQDLETWDVQQVATFLEISPDSVRRQMSRWSIPRAGTGQSEAGRMTALYSAAKVRAAHKARPGRGARTDLPQT